MEEIRAIDKSIRDLMSGSKFAIDVYQREYRWGKDQIEELVLDLTRKFNESYQSEHDRRDVDQYGRYFLGSIVISNRDGRNYIIDGQQRLTTITLMMIYLHRALEADGHESPLADLIFSLRLGERSFNLDIPERKDCMEALYNAQPFDEAEQPESVINILDAFENIEEQMPDKLSEGAIAYFTDWLIEKVHFVQITTQTDDDAYTIFETMNDRGLSPSPTDLLKGYLLANMAVNRRDKANQVWRARVENLLRVGDHGSLNHAEPANAIRAWLRGKHAKYGDSSDDFDAIGTSFNRWVSGNQTGLGLSGQGAFSDFVEKDFDFYCKWYEKLRQTASNLDQSLPEIYYNAHNTFTLQYPLLLAPLEVSDSETCIQAKLKLTGTYIDILLARRIWNGRSIVYKEMDREMYGLMVEVRGKTLSELKTLLANRIAEEQCTFSGANQFALNGRNRPKIRAILARITDHVEMMANHGSPNFETYVRGGKNRFEIEHIWADHYDRHTDEFNQQHEFAEYRNRIGGLLLLPKSFNASYGDSPYADKRDHYNSQNLLARSLHEKAYDHNPGFKSFIDSSGLAFKAHPNFKTVDLDERQVLYCNIAELVWAPSRLQ